MEILDNVRYWMPKQHVLDSFQRKKILYSEDTPNDGQLWSAVAGDTSQAVLTAS